MAYVAVKGGQEAIEESILRIKMERLKAKEAIQDHTIENSMRLLVDQVMSEASLYAPKLAALAIKQGEGSLEEAVFLLRAYRSTLPRKYYSAIIESSSMNIERRISAAFKDIAGGQILGTAYDYKHRLLDFDLRHEKQEEIDEFIEQFYQRFTIDHSTEPTLKLPSVTDYLRDEGLIQTYPIDNRNPKDITKEMLTFPTVRSERLQILTRGMTQAVISLGYASLRGYGAVHPTVAELRIGSLPVAINDPTSPQDEENQYTIGEIKVTQVESLIPVTVRQKDGSNLINFEIGYGITLGQNETKAIAMSILDRCLENKNAAFATHDEEFVLYHIDSVEATGFISHLKLPHYVTFQSKLNSAREIRKGKSHEE